MTELATKQTQIETMELAMNLTASIGAIVDAVIDAKTNHECLLDGYNRIQHLLSIVEDKKAFLETIEDLLREKALKLIK